MEGGKEKGREGGRKGVKKKEKKGSLISEKEKGVCWKEREKEGVQRRENIGRMEEERMRRNTRREGKEDGRGDKVVERGRERKRGYKGNMEKGIESRRSEGCEREVKKGEKKEEGGTLKQ